MCRSGRAGVVSTAEDWEAPCVSVVVKLVEFVEIATRSSWSRELPASVKEKKRGCESESVLCDVASTDWLMKLDAYAANVVGRDIVRRESSELRLSRRVDLEVGHVHQGRGHGVTCDHPPNFTPKCE